MIDGSRKQRIAKGAGVQTKQINELLKQYNMMKPMLTSMAGKGGKGRMESMREMQAQMMNPGSGWGLKPNRQRESVLLPLRRKKQNANAIRKCVSDAEAMARVVEQVFNLFGGKAG